MGGTAIATTGVRVPAFVISPHVAPGLPFTDPVDHTSFLQLLADRFNPGQNYSPEVAARQVNLGSLATALTQVPGVSAAVGKAPPAIPQSTTSGLTAAIAAAPASAGVAELAERLKTAEAFHNVAMKVATDHPDLLATSGWSKLADYVDSQTEAA